MALIGCLLGSGAAAQFYPPPFNPPPFDYRQYPRIRHDVPYHSQNTMGWCWVAVAKMVAEHYARGRVPSQCTMLEQQYGAPCCSNSGLCMRPGHITEVQALVERFGGRISTMVPPADGFALYNALRRGPIILHTQQGGGHFVVATGMEVVPSAYGPMGMVFIHDPFFGRKTIDFPTLMGMWSGAILVL